MRLNSREDFPEIQTIVSGFLCIQGKVNICFQYFSWGKDHMDQADTIAQLDPYDQVS